MPSTAQKGRALEHKIRHMFETEGWDVIRGAGSKGAFGGLKADLIATKKGTLYKETVHLKLGSTETDDGVFDTVVIQCKKARL